MLDLSLFPKRGPDHNSPHSKTQHGSDNSSNNNVGDNNTICNIFITTLLNMVPKTGY